MLHGCALDLPIITRSKFDCEERYCEVGASLELDFALQDGLLERQARDREHEPAPRTAALGSGGEGPVRARAQTGHGGRTLQHGDGSADFERGDVARDVHHVGVEAAAAGRTGRHAGSESETVEAASAAAPVNAELGENRYEV